MEDFIRISKHIFPTLVAITASEQEKGLMGVNWPPPVMTFVYNSPRVNKFWMSNTPSPLDIVFCSSGKIVNICNGKPYSTEIIGNDKPTDLVIELPAGTCETKNINIGDEVEANYSPTSLLKIYSSLRQNKFNY